MRRGLMLLVTPAVVLWCSTSLASLQVGNWISLHWESGQYASPGGAFRVNVYADEESKTVINTFATFCTELEQHIRLGRRYEVTNIGDTNTSGRSLSEFGKWLFYGFSTDLESGDVVPEYGDLSPATAGAIQYGLWNDLGYTDAQIPWNSSTELAFAEDVAAWRSVYETDPGWIHHGDVKIAQLGLGGGNQDQAVYIPAGSLSVPEPASLAVWSLLAGFLAAGAKFRCRT